MFSNSLKGFFVDAIDHQEILDLVFFDNELPLYLDGLLPE